LENLFSKLDHESLGNWKGLGGSEGK